MPLGRSPPATTPNLAAAAAPGVPTNVVATPAGSHTLHLSWTAPASNGGPITGYKITGTPLAGASVDGSTTQATLGCLTTGTPYTFTVTATNLVGTSPVSSASAPATPSASGSTNFGWAACSGATQPQSRASAAMAYDAARHQTVLYGGCAGTSGGCGYGGAANTWVWDGSV